MKTIKVLFVSLLTLFVFNGYSQGVNIIVRAKAKDAKFIGSGIGGASVIIRNAATGEILAKGKTTGIAGNTELIMSTPKGRYTEITDDKTAKFQAHLDITEPTFVTIEAIAPVNRKNAAVNSQTQLWLIPGKDLVGEGIILEIPGFILDVLYPQTHQIIKSAAVVDNKINVKINLVMMCGCDIAKGAVWDSEYIEVSALVKKDGVPQKTIKLTISKQENVFEGLLDLSGKGNYELQVYAFEKRTNNTGFDAVNFIVN